MHHSPRCSHNRQFGFTLVELLVVIAIIGILIGMLLPAVQQVREAARRITCSNNMRQVSLALHNFHDTNSEFPVGAILNQSTPNGNYGFLAFTLPFLEQGNLFNQINVNDTTQPPSPDLDQGGAIIPGLVCPSSALPERSSEGYAKCNYLGNQGTGNTRNTDDGGVFDTNAVYGISDITDGTSNTIFVGEADGSPVEINELDDNSFPAWIGAPGFNGQYAHSRARRRVLRRTDFSTGFNFPHSNGVPGDFNPSVFSSRHPGGANFGFVDGSVHFINDTIDTGTSNNPPNAGTFIRLMVRDDGQVVGDF